MHGSTSLLQFGPETMNYQRTDASTVYPARMKFEIPSDTRYIHKITISWKLGAYRADVTGGSESEGHSHTGYAGSGGAHTSDVLNGGAHTPVALSSAHTHAVTGSITLSFTAYNRLFITNYNTSYEDQHTHTNPDTGNEPTPRHTHTYGTCTGGPDSTAYAIIAFGSGSSCGSGYCVDFNDIDAASFADSSHDHYVSGTTGVATAHHHPVGATGKGSQHYHVLAYDLYYVIDPDTMTGAFSLGVAATEDPAHAHVINGVSAHPHTGVDVTAHTDHIIETEAAGDVDLDFGITEIPGGTVMMLIINGETVASDYDGDQTNIVITGYCGTGNNSIEIQPAVGQNSKGSTSMVGSGTIFIEAKKF